MVEITVIISLWIIAIVAPLLFMDDIGQDRVAVHIMWAEYCVVGFAFIINRSLLMPRLFFKRAYAKYIISLLVLFLLLALLVLHFDVVRGILTLFRDNELEPPMPIGGGGVGAPIHSMPPHSMLHMTSPHAGGGIPPAVTVLILSAMVIALDMGLSIAVKWFVAEQKQSEENRERIMAQLQNLQSQVSPHFFMNTLNNIHALVDIDSQRAKQTIISLSSLMDYLLYESSTKDSVSLQREIDFIDSYISLMRLRYSKHVVIDFAYDEPVPSLKIPPLLFLNFIENAFKYGVDNDSDSIIKIRFSLSESYIEMTALNSNHAHLSKSERHGLGISNSRKRLELLYGDSYTLDISDMGEMYHVMLKIPVVYDN